MTGRTMFLKEAFATLSISFDVSNRCQ
jgi:hypothetical protein